MEFPLIMKNKIYYIPILLFSFIQIINAQVLPGYEDGLKTISAKELKQYVYFLADDSMKGRAAGSDENLLAAMFIAEKFREAGLTPAFPDKYNRKKEESDYNAPLKISNAGLYDEFFQKFTLQKTKLTENCALSVTQKNEVGSVEVSYEMGKDFFIKYSGGEDVKYEAPMVFLGYGIFDGENDYSDFVDSDGKEIDLKDKIAVMVDSYPQANDTASAFSIANKIEYRIFKHKAKYALDKGALAVFSVQSPLFQEAPVDIKYDKTLDLAERVYTNLHERERKEIPVIYPTNKIVKEIFEHMCDKDLKSLLTKIDTELKPQSFEFPNISVSIKIDLEYETLNTQNVIAYIEGSDPALKDEVVVFSGHYDHVGIGEYGALDKSRIGEVHNGADDNASGTSGLIELAQAFSVSKPKRSAIFIGFSAEENGLLGSKFYVRNQPVFPIEKTVAIINLDMIGRNAPELVWVGGAFYGRDIIETAKQANSLVGMELLYNIGFLGNASDQAPFLHEDIPAIFFFAGLHDDYHTPDDDADKLDYNKMKRITDLAFLSGWILTNQEKNPVYVDIPMDERSEIVKDSVKRQRKFDKK